MHLGLDRKIISIFESHVKAHLFNDSYQQISKASCKTLKPIHDIIRDRIMCMVALGGT